MLIKRGCPLPQNASCCSERSNHGRCPWTVDEGILSQHIWAKYRRQLDNCPWNSLEISNTKYRILNQLIINSAWTCLLLLLFPMAYPSPDPGWGGRGLFVATFASHNIPSRTAWSRPSGTSRWHLRVCPSNCQHSHKNNDNQMKRFFFF